MVVLGIVAVGRTGGTILSDDNRFPRGIVRGASRDRHAHANSDGTRVRLHPTGILTSSNRSIMRRAFALAVAGISLAGCSSFSTDNWNYFKSTPTTIQVQLESTPPGADARTSVGPGCKTPCSVSVLPPETGFTVSYALPGMQPASVPVRVTRESGGMFSSDTFKVSPNPVFAELQPAAPPPRAHRPHPKHKKPAAAAAGAAPAAAAAPDSAFPNPGAAPASQR